MIRRSSFNTVALGVIYLVALTVAGALIVQTLSLARTLPDVRAAAATAAFASPTSAPTAAPMIVLPTPVPPTPVPTAADPQTAPVSYHPKSGRYIVVWLPPDFEGGARESFFANADIIDYISPFWYSNDAGVHLFFTRNDELVRIAH